MTRILENIVFAVIFLIKFSLGNKRRDIMGIHWMCCHILWCCTSKQVQHHRCEYHYSKESWNKSLIHVTHVTESCLIFWREWGKYEKKNHWSGCDTTQYFTCYDASTYDKSWLVHTHVSRCSKIGYKTRIFPRNILGASLTR